MGLVAEKLDSQSLSRVQPLVLVVDDESAICSTLSSILRDEGFETLTAASGDEALGVVLEQRPAIVFLDIWMPGRDGLETLQLIKEISPSTQVIMISGHATIANALEATRRGAFDFIEKPLDLESIMLAVQRGFERCKEMLDTEPRAKKLEVVPRSSAAPSLQPLISHPGILSSALRGRNVGQRTLRRGAILYGHCLHSGQKSGLVLEPLPANSGIHFARIGDTKTVPAFIDYVQSTGFATTVRSGGTAAATIEHLMAALHAYEITNLLIKCNDEVPIFDGSAIEFCNTIEQAGIEEQDGDWFEVAIDRPVTLTGHGLDKTDSKRPQSESETLALEAISIEPGPEFKICYELNYPDPIGSQYFEYVHKGPESFKREIAPARTFGFMKDIERLQKAGLAAGGRLDNFILIGPDKVINTELRFPEELARHKILDVMGDLFLLGRMLRGTVRARMTGHSDNVSLLRALRAVAVD